MSVNSFDALTEGQEIQVLVLAPERMNHVTLGRSLHLSEPQFSRLQNQRTVALYSLKFPCGGIEKSLLPAILGYCAEYVIKPG